MFAVSRFFSRAIFVAYAQNRGKSIHEKNDASSWNVDIVSDEMGKILFRS